MSTEDIERATQVHQLALTTLLLEFDSLTDKELRGLVRKYDPLVQALDAVIHSRKELFDLTFLESAARQQREDAEIDGLTPLVQLVTEDGEWEWWSFPGVNGHTTEKDTVSFYKDLNDGRRMLVRSLPRDWVGEVRNVPREHPLVLNAKEWTIENQGQPSWSEELVSLEPRIQHLADSNGVDAHLIRAFVGSTGEMPDEDWYQTAKANAFTER